jgi:hypothetical protein
MKTNHFKKPKIGRIVHPSKQEMNFISKPSDDTGAIMGIMIIVTLGLLGLVAANEYTDH